MQDQLTARLKELARRAGLTNVPPVAVAAALALCALIVVSAAWRWWPRGVVAEPAPAQVGTATAGEAGGVGGELTAGTDSPSAGGELRSPSASSTVFVHVVGAVRHPGMFELPAGARVADAVGAAGGLAGNAAQAGVNLARPVTDGEQVVVPTIDEYAKGAQPAPGGAAPAAGAGAAGAAGAAAGALVNVNTADVTALDTLPGVGPSTAAKIVAEREANGPFTSPDDLARVAGIGPKKLEELKPRVSVN